MNAIRSLASLLAFCSVLALASSTDTILYERFDEGWEERWTPSVKEAYQGVWKHEKSEGHEDFGLLVSEKARKYGIATEFSEKVDFNDEPVVLQYDLRLQNGLECGGAYLKYLLPQEAGWTAAQLDNESPYSIMFGPDKCGSTNKIHFIFRHKHPKSQKFIEHHLKYPPSVINDKLSHVYTAIIYPNNTLIILVDGVVKKSADLLSNDFQPPVLPPKTIPDPEDKKPEDWDERAKIADTKAKKPEDWDEDAPMNIEDMDAVKPEGWLDDEPKEVDDPEAVKPDDWDDEEDGEWGAPKIPNPKCSKASGCGKWIRPTKRNPAYRGKWHAPMIDNPNYKGIWKPREIPNPDYFELDKPNLEPLAGIGIEIWTMQDGILFDNVLVTRAESVAQRYREETWKVKYKVEKKKSEEEVKAEAASTSILAGLQEHVFKFLYRFAELPFLGAYREKLEDLIMMGEERPVLTMTIIGMLLVVSLMTTFKLLFGGKKSSKGFQIKKAKKEDISSADDVSSEKAVPTHILVENEKGEDGEEISGARHRKSRRAA